MPKPTPLPLHLPYAEMRRQLVEGKFISEGDMKAAEHWTYHPGEAKLKHDWAPSVGDAMDRRNLMDLWPDVISKLCLVSERPFIIGSIEEQQHSPARLDEPARHSKKPRGTRGTRGPEAEVTPRVIMKMMDDLHSGSLTVRQGRLFDGTRRLLQKELMARYACSASTYLNALDTVLSEFQTPTNSDKK